MVIEQLILADPTGIQASVLNLTNSNPVAVAIVDSNGDQLASIGGGQEYTEDAAAAANPIGKSIILVRADTPGAVSDTDGDNVAQRGTNYGAAFVQIVDSSGAFVDSFGGGIEYTEGDTDATIIGKAILWEDAGDTLTPVSAAKPLPVNITAGAVITEYTEDAASAANPVGGVIIAVRADTPAAVTDTDGDNVALRATNKGELYVKHVDALALPTGAATAANQATIIGHVDGIEGHVDGIEALLAGTLTVQASNLDIRDLLFATDKVDVSGSTLGANSGVDIGDVTINNGAGGAAVNIQDGGNSITIDNAGSFAVQEDGPLLASAQLLDDTVATFGVDLYAEATTKAIIIGGVRRDADTTLVDTTNEIAPFQINDAGQLKVEIFDGGDSHTVDNAGAFAVQEDGAALTALQLIDDAIFADDAAFTPGVSKVMVAGFEYDDSAPDSVNEGDAGAARMSANRNIYVQIRDNAGNERGLNIDANGALSALVAGDVAHDSADSGNPVKIGFKAASGFPTASANADRVNGISDLWGRQLTSHIDPAQQVAKSFNATTQQTGTDVWDPGASNKIAITSIVIGTYGTTAGRLILWFGDNADTTYSAGTDQLVLAASFAPSTTSKPGLVYTPAVPIFCTTADRELHITTDAALSVDIAVYGYEFA